MTTYALTSVILSIAVLLGLINHRFIKMQSTIAIMAGALLLSFILILLQHFGIANVADTARQLIIRTDFNHLLLNGMLSFLLFAGALTIDFSTLKSQKWEIGTLASISTIASTLIIGTLTYYLLPLLGLQMPYLYCLLFGALISPTDPIAVLAIFKQVGAPKKLEMCVAGESLFNDGVAIVIFLTLYQLTFKGAPITVSNVILLFLKQAIGGILYGAVLGTVVHWLIKDLKDYKMAALITLAAVSGGYTLAMKLDISGALAMVVAGILVGYKRKTYKHKQTIEALEMFWEIIDEILNAVLFLLIGFELLTIHASSVQIVAALAAIPMVLLVRLITVAIPMKFFQLKRSRQPYAIAILTWGGLRGGLAVALALSLPLGEHRDFIIALTYSVVAFAVIIQGSTIKPLTQLAKRLQSD